MMDGEKVTDVDLETFVSVMGQGLVEEKNLLERQWDWNVWGMGQSLHLSMMFQVQDL